MLASIILYSFEKSFAELIALKALSIAVLRSPTILDFAIITS